jgi:serine/threonine protein kinase
MANCLWLIKNWVYMTKKILNERYQILKELAGQAGRKTFLALDLTTQKQVVVKLLYFAPDFDWQDLKLFQREADILKKLEHPAIPRYLDYFEIDTPNEKGFGLVQTYIAHKSLEEHLRAGRTFNETEVKELAQSLLEILDYLHSFSSPIIHRDIKPSNILLTNRSGNSIGQVYLVDFGSVQNAAAKEEGTITVVGTYGYMPPEQFGGRVTPASDLYSLGATLIYLVTGLHPTELQQKDSQIKDSQIQDSQIQFRQSSNLSPQFTDWLEWMTEPNLNQRFTTAKKAIEGLENTPPRNKSILLAKKRLQKPSDSNIRLIKKRGSVEIIFPPKGFGISVISFISLLSPLALGMNFFSNQVLSDVPNTNILLVPLQVLASTYIIFTIIWALFKRIRVRIDSQVFEVFHELPGFKWRASPVEARQNISYLKFAPVFVAGFQSHMKLNVAANTKYNLDIYGNLSEEEIMWLIQEMNDYLKM